MTGEKLSGALDPVSLFVRFNFTQVKLLEAVSTWLQASAAGPAGKPGPMATYVHELAHYVQYTTTTYGIFLQYCRRLQNDATIEVIRQLPPGTLPLPLGQEQPAGDQAAVAWAAWWSIENLIAAMGTDRERRRAIRAMFASARPAALLERSLLDLPRTFHHVQSALANHIRRHAEPDLAGFLNSGLFLPGQSNAALWLALATPPSTMDVSDEQRQLDQDLSGYEWSAEAVIESAAVAAELWDTDVTMARIRAWLARAATPAQAVYRSCLRRALDAIQTEDAAAFLLSYMVICEMVLMAPLLPMHVKMRGPVFRFAQILPAWRFEALLGAAEGVAPMRDRRERSRYVDELFTRLPNWVHPDRVREADASAPLVQGFPLSQVYREAQQWRGLEPTSMIGSDRLLVVGEAQADAWRNRFNFVILDYADKTTYHTDKPFLHAMTDRYLETLALRTLMLGTGWRIAAPYGRDVRENDYMTRYIRAYLASVVPGRDFKEVVVE